MPAGPEITPGLSCVAPQCRLHSCNGHTPAGALPDVRYALRHAAARLPGMPSAGRTRIVERVREHSALVLCQEISKCAQDLAGVWAERRPDRTVPRRQCRCRDTR